MHLDINEAKLHYTRLKLVYESKKEKTNSIIKKLFQLFNGI